MSEWGTSNEADGGWGNGEENGGDNGGDDAGPSGDSGKMTKIFDDLVRYS